MSCVELRGYTPQHVVQRGDPCATLLRHGAVSPNNVPEKKGKGARVRHGLQAPYQRVRIELEEG